MSKVSSDTLYRIGTAMTAYLYAAASLNSSTANEIASLCVNEAIERLRSTCTPFLLEIEEARIKKIATATGLVLDSEINRLKAALQTDLAAANSNSIDNKQLENNPVFKKVAYRTVIGPMTLEHLSLLQRKKYRIQPAWSGKWHLALSWINGKRNLGEIFRNAASETTGLTIEDFLEYFTMLEKEKLISLKLPDAKSF
jgi:hypothetical protein